MEEGGLEGTERGQDREKKEEEEKEAVEITLSFTAESV